MKTEDVNMKKIHIYNGLGNEKFSKWVEQQNGYN